MTRSNSTKGQGANVPVPAKLRNLTTLAQSALLVAFCVTPNHSRAATAPTATLLYSDSAAASIHGGVATIGTGGDTYVALLSVGTTTPARVIRLNGSGSVQWTFTAPGTGTAYDMYAIPALDASGAKLYIGSDKGIFYCFNTNNGSVAWSYTVTTGTDKRIRSGAAIDPNNPLGPTVYFHCNNGLLYALNADTGALRWTAATGNAGGPPTAPSPYAPGGDWDPHPVSSSPVVDSASVVYVGSADGSVYSFNPSSGAQIWRLVLNSSSIEPVEASIAIGPNGLLYAATRVNSSMIGGTIYAINALNQSIVWTFPTGGTAGYIASPVVDQSGFIYATWFDNKIFKLNPLDGGLATLWVFPGKLCQTPSINQKGLLILGVSAIGQSEVNEIASVYIEDISTAAPYWEIDQVNGQSFGNSFGSPAILCASSGTTYFADTTGKLCTFDSGAAMMAGTWPTFQCGNRRAGKSITYPTAFAELPPFFCTGSPYCGYSAVSRVDIWGRAVGQSYGDYTYPIGGDTGFAAALWFANPSIKTPGRYSGNSNTYATALNGLGDVCGYRTSPSYAPMAWPDGANSDTGYHVLASTGFSAAYAYAINASGTIVGYGTTGGTANVLR